MQLRVRSTLIVTLLLALTSVGPAIATHGTWLGATGAREPDTMWDTSPYMFQDANTKAVEKIYLNGFVIHDDLLVAPANSFDVQLQGGTVLTPVSMKFAAMLGFWRDCNEDGYIGMLGAPASYGSFSVYPRALAEGTINETICPPDSPYNPNNVATGQANGYIDEFRWIGPSLIDSDPNAPPPKLCVPPSNPNSPACVSAGPAVEDPYDVDDPGAKMWVDWNFPGGSHIPHQGLTAHPPGTFADSEGSLKYVDDATQGQFSGLLGNIWTGKPRIGECDDTPTFSGGPGGTCGYWPLYQVNRLVSDRPDAQSDPQPVVQVFDTTQDDSGDGNPCNDGFDQTVGTTRIAAAGLDPRVHPAFLVQGSLQGTATNVYRGANVHNLTNQANDNECGDDVFGPDSTENGQLDAEPTHRVATDYLEFIPDQRMRTLAAQGFDYAPGDVVGVGVRSGVVSPGADSPGWYGQFGWTGRPPRTGFGSLSAAYATFYADVTTAAFADNPLANPVTAFPATRQNAYVYGAEFCPAFTVGASNVNPANLWECSVTVWEDKRYSDATANDPTPNPEILARPILGAAYDLRDVDCYDNTLSEFTGATRVGIADCSATHQ